MYRQKNVVKCLFYILLLCSTKLALSGSCPLSPVAGSPFNTNGTSTYSVAYAPDGKTLITANETSNDVSLFTVNTDGSLTLQGNFSIDGVRPFYASYSPDGNYIATANYNSNSISVFRLNAATNTLTLIPGSPFATGFSPIDASSPVAVLYSPDGKHVASINAASRNVSIFEVDPTTGALTLTAPLFAVGGNTPSSPVGGAYSPDGKHLIVANWGANNVSSFKVNPVTGGLTLVNPLFSTGGTNPSSIAFSPDGKYAAVPNETTNSVSIFSVQGNGELLLISSPVATGGTGPIPAVYSPDGNYLAVANTGSDNISLFAVNQENGFISLVNNAPFTLDAGSLSPRSLAYSPDGLYLAAGNNSSNNVAIFALPSVAITPENPNLCAGDGLTLAGTVATGTPPFTYSWTGPNGFTSNEQTITLSNVSRENAGVYTLIVTANDCEQTQASTIVTVGICSDSALVNLVIAKYC